jgi:RNA polymerase sigma-70 factor (ECF subfamily)
MSVELRLFRDLSFAEVAREMDTSEDSAKSNYHHAMKRLRTHLEDEETSTPAGNDAAHDVRK